MIKTSKDKTYTILCFCNSGDSLQISRPVFILWGRNFMQKIVHISIIQHN